MSKQEAWKCDHCGELMHILEVSVQQVVRFASGIVIEAGDYHQRCFARLAGQKDPVFRDSDWSDRDTASTRGGGASGPLPPPSLPASRGVRVARKLATR